MQKRVFFDTETTGIGEEDYLCQIAYKIDDGKHAGFMAIYKPPLNIPPGASAVHHITNEMVKDKEAFTESKDFKNIKELFEHEDTVMIAHNIVFDLGMIKKEGILPRNTICTLRVARHLDKDGKLAKHNLQFLRYALNINIDATAHDAMGDVLVLEELFKRLLAKIMAEGKNEEEAIAEMVEISSRPSLFRSFSFGKYSGKKVEEVAKTDAGYLEWLLKQKLESDRGDEDWVYTLKHYLQK